MNELLAKDDYDSSDSEKGKSENSGKRMPRNTILKTFSKVDNFMAMLFKNKTPNLTRANSKLNIEKIPEEDIENKSRFKISRSSVPIRQFSVNDHSKLLYSDADTLAPGSGG